ncbi:hypothetical protein [Leifsonia sp. P73]|uniref:hypothetical protein n=1 Tax=Leifsonia sp. P73 TaxID=3423959 RepID=UPI003DA3A73E
MEVKDGLVPPLIRWERDLERHLFEHPELLGLLIFGWQVSAGLMRRIDLLGIDAAGDIYVIEVKRKVPSDRVVAQVLDYVHWARTATLDQLIAVAARRRVRLDLLAAFKQRFGHPLPERSNRTVRIIIVAAALDLRTYRSLEVLNDGPHPAVALRYRVTGDSIALKEIQEGDVAPQRNGKAIKSTAPAPSIAMDGPHRDGVAPDVSGSAEPTALLQSSKGCSPVHDDVREFWEMFSVLFTWPFVPFRLVYDRYETWRYEEKKEGRHRSRQQDGHFGQQIAALVRESREWSYERTPLSDLAAEDGACPYLPSLSEGYRRRRVSGYRRSTPNHMSHARDLALRGLTVADLGRPNEAPHPGYQTT